MSTLHIYGDSFSTGYGLNKSVGFVQKPFGKYVPYTWDKNICNFFDYSNVSNKARPASSNEVIHNTFIGDMINFKRGDTVIIGLSDSSRMSLPVNYNKKEVEYLNINGAIYRESLINSISDNPEVNFIPDYLKPVCSRNNIPITMFTTALKFYEEWREDETFTKMRYSMLKDRILENIKFLATLGVAVYVWDSALWYMYENINSWTKGKYVDFHWSPNGHRSFLSLLIWCIDNSYNYIDTELYGNNESAILNFSKSKSLDQYID